MGSTPSIYMVDDDIAICELVNMLIQTTGYNFDAQYKLQGAYEAIEEKHPDLILLDLHLPDGNGLNLCKKLKKNAKLKHIPIIILTTREFNIEKEIAYKAGADLFLSKPIGSEELLEAINEFLSKKITVKIWGARGSMPTAEADKMHYGGNTPCVQLTIPDVEETIILDAGTGIKRLGDYLMQQRQQINAFVFITHPHWDHIQGLPFFKPLYAENNRLYISMPEQLDGGCEEVLSGQMQYTYFPVTPKMLRADIRFTDQPPSEVSYNGFKVSYILANHPTNTAMYKIQAHGKSIIYAPDNELIAYQDPEDNTFLHHMIRFCEGADLLIHDAQYSYENYEQFRSWGHSPWQETLKIAKLAGVKKLMLFSHDPGSSDEHLNHLNSLLDAHRKDFSDLWLAKELDVYNLPV